MLPIDGHRLLSRLDIVQVNLTLCSLLHQFKRVQTSLTLYSLNRIIAADKAANLLTLGQISKLTCPLLNRNIAEINLLTQKKKLDIWNRRKKGGRLKV